MPKPLKCAVIGCGVIAPTHVESYLKQDAVEVTWACDIVEDKARRLAGEYGIPNVCADYAAVMADPELDCVSVCTDHASHTPITVAALEAGKHVLCEKALAATTDGLDRMMAAHAQRDDLVFSGVFQHRFDPVLASMKRLVDEDVLGTMLTAGIQVRCLRTKDYYRADRWRGTWAQEGGAVLINQAIHFIDALAWIVGGAQAVAGAHVNLTHDDAMETEDTAVAALRFNSSALGTIEATCASHIDWEWTLSLHGSAGSVDLRDGKPLKVISSDNELARTVERELAGSRQKRRIEAGKTYYGLGHPSQVADFVAAIRQHRAPLVPASSARHAVDIVLGVYESQRHGKWVELTDR